MNVRGLEFRFLIAVARVTESRLFLLQHERSDDAVAFVTGFAAIRVLKRSVHNLLLLLLQKWLMTLSTRFRGQTPLERRAGDRNRREPQ